MSSTAIERVKPPKLFSKPVKILKKYPSGQSGDLKKDHMSLSCCLCEMPLDMETERTIELLINIMSATMFSPLNRILLSNGFIASFAGVHFHLLQPLFSIALKSVSHNDISRVEALVLFALRMFMEKGFDADAVEASMNMMEISLKENVIGSVP